MLQLIRNIRSAGRTWVLALTALTVVSCAKDLGAPEIVERAGLTISLTVPQSVEREMRNPRTYAGTEPGYGQESVINSLYIVFYSRSKEALGARADWKEVATKTLEKEDLPSFTGTTGGNPTSTFTVEGIPVTPSALDGGTELRAVIYANYNQNPDAITAESDLWKGSTLNPLFFTGTGVFGKVNDTWTANVNLTRQVAKLRIKAGIHPDAVPSTLEIDPRSISVTVEKMASASPTTDDGNNPDHKDYDPGDTFAGMEQTIVRSTTSGTPLRMEENWASGMKIDSLYMHPHDASTDKEKATVVKISMKVSDPVSAESKTLTLEYPLGKLNAETGQMDYTIKRNTIYTLDVQVQSIESGGSLNANLEIHDWDDAVIDIDAPWGEAVTSHSALYVLPGEGSTVMTVAAGGGTEPFSVTLMKPDRSGTLDASLASLYRDGSFAAGNTFLLEPSSKAEVQFTATEQFAGAWLKIVKTKGGQPAGLARYIPVGKAEFSAANGSATYAGGDFASQIVCRAAMPDGTTEPLEWTAETVDAGGASAPVPDWLTIQTSTGNLSGSVAAQENSHRMQTEAAVVNYDLSTRDGLMNTANCYLVHAPGTYSLPLVYGNAIKDGATNAAAYTSTAATSNNILNPFINHLGIGITDPYIKNNNNITLTEAKLLWQDVEGMIDASSVSISGDNLTFRVTNSIDYGNAVLAVYDDQNPKQIAWSWHIWATDYELGTDLVVTNGTHKIWPIHLGWCPGPEYEARSQRLLLTEAGTGATVIVTVDQAAYKGLGNHPYYQWGRKDPQLPSDGTTNTNKTWYNEMGTPSTVWDYRQLRTSTSQDAKEVIQACIQNPMTFSHGASTDTGLNSLDKLDGQYSNLWAANSGFVTAGSYLNESTKKTVYDPCPAGYKVSMGNALAPLITNRGTWSTTPAGRYFDCTDESGNPATVFFPASGYRSSSTGVLGGVGSEGDAWMVETKEERNGYNMVFLNTDASIKLQNNAVRSNGIPVRPEKE